MTKRLLLDVNKPKQLQKALDSVRNEMESDSVIHEPAISSKKLVEQLVANRIKAVLASEPQKTLDLLELAEANQLRLVPYLSDPNFLNGLC